MAGNLDDDELWAQFHAATLPSAAWTHRAHLRMAWLFQRAHSLDEAHLLMRVGIIKLNAAHGLVESAHRGYHETLTRVWLELVAAAERDTPSIDSRAFVSAHVERLGREAPLRHYTKGVLFGLEARARFVPPDLAPLPFAIVPRAPLSRAGTEPYGELPSS